MTWSSQQYLKFEDERRGRARSLQAVPTARVSSAANLGCGPGNSTELLVEHYPDASIVGVDNSPEMIEAAQKRLPSVKFRLGSIKEWNEPGPWDILFANAAFQWIGDHERLLGRLWSGSRQGEASRSKCRTISTSLPMRPCVRWHAALRFRDAQKSGKGPPQVTR